MDLFKGFVDDFNYLSESVEEKMASISYLKGDEKSRACADVQNMIDELQQTVNSMSLSIRTVTSKSQADEMQASLNNYKNKIKNFKKQLSSAQYEANRLALYGNDDDLGSSLRHRDEMLSNTERLEKTTDIIKGTVQRAEGAYGVGADTLVQLDEDSERIERARDRMSGIRGRMSDARRMLGAIEGRMTVNKLIKILIILSLIAFICAIVYLRWIRSKGTQPTTPTTPITPTNPDVPTSENTTNAEAVVDMSVN